MIRLAAILVTTAAVLMAAVFSLPSLLAVSYERTDAKGNETAEKLIEPESLPDGREEVKHQPLPEEVKAIYMTSCVVGTRDFRDRLVSLIEETELNSLVIDIKDFSGTISFPPESDEWRPAWTAAKCGSADMKEFIAELHEKGIFVIGRVTVF